VSSPTTDRGWLLRTTIAIIITTVQVSSVFAGISSFRDPFAPNISGDHMHTVYESVDPFIMTTKRLLATLLIIVKPDAWTKKEGTPFRLHVHSSHPDAS
jgi:hypothetical protein